MQAYFDPKRADGPHALPDVEIFHLGHNEIQGDMREWAVERMEDGETLPDDLIGWYWQACFPGCLPDGDPVGPFASREEALADAQEGSQS